MLSYIFRIRNKFLNFSCLETLEQVPLLDVFGGSAVSRHVQMKFDHLNFFLAVAVAILTALVTYSSH